MKKIIILVFLIISICCTFLTACSTSNMNVDGSIVGSEEVTEHKEVEIPENAVAVIKLSILPDDYTLRNAEGQEVVYKEEDASFTGDLEIQEEYFTTMAYFIHVKESDSFTFQTQKEEYIFSLIGHKVYARVEGKNINTIFVDADGTVQLTGENMEYRVSVDVYEDGKGTIETSGSGSGTLTILRE